MATGGWPARRTGQRPGAHLTGREALATAAPAGPRPRSPRCPTRTGVHRVPARRSRRRRETPRWLDTPGNQYGKYETLRRLMESPLRNAGPFPTPRRDGSGPFVLLQPIIGIPFCSRRKVQHRRRCTQTGYTVLSPCIERSRLITIKIQTSTLETPIDSPPDYYKFRRSLGPVASNVPLPPPYTS